VSRFLYQKRSRYCCWTDLIWKCIFVYVHISNISKRRLIRQVLLKNWDLPLPSVNIILLFFRNTTHIKFMYIRVVKRTLKSVYILQSNKVYFQFWGCTRNYILYIDLNRGGVHVCTEYMVPTAIAGALAVMAFHLVVVFRAGHVVAVAGRSALLGNHRRCVESIKRTTDTTLIDYERTYIHVFIHQTQ